MIRAVLLQYRSDLCYRVLWIILKQYMYMVFVGFHALNVSVIFNTRVKQELFDVVTETAKEQLLPYFVTNMRCTISRFLFSGVRRPTSSAEGITRSRLLAARKCFLLIRLPDACVLLSMSRKISTGTLTARGLSAAASWYVLTASGISISP